MVSLIDDHRKYLFCPFEHAGVEQMQKNRFHFKVNLYMCKVCLLQDNKAEKGAQNAEAVRLFYYISLSFPTPLRIDIHN